MKHIRTLACLLFAWMAAAPVHAALLHFHLAGTINGTLPGTTIVAGDPFSASFRLDTSAPQYIAGAFSFSNSTMSQLVASVDNAGNFTHGYTRTANGSGELAIGVIAPKFGPPWNGLGNYGRLTFYFPGVLQFNDFSTMTLAGLQGAPLWGTVEAQAWAITGLTIDTAEISAVPLPASIVLLAAGLVGLGFTRVRRPGR